MAQSATLLLGGLLLRWTRTIAPTYRVVFATGFTKGLLDGVDEASVNGTKNK